MPLTPPTYAAANDLDVTASAEDAIVELAVDATGGDYDLLYGGQTAAAIAFDATAAEVQTAIIALSNIDAAGCVVSGEDGGPYTIQLVGTEGDATATAFTTTDTNLTGGGSACTVTVIRPGHAGGSVTVNKFIENQKLYVSDTNDNVYEPNELGEVNLIQLG